MADGSVSASTAAEGDIAAASLQALEGEKEEVPTVEAEQKKEGVPIAEAEHKKIDPLFKTSLCSYFRKLGSCRHGLQCRYAHGDGELRPRPDGTWDPTSSKGRAAQRSENQPPQSKEKEEEEESGGDFDGADEGLVSGMSSLRKCIQDLPLRWSSDDFRKFLAEKGLVFRSSRKRKRSNIGFVDFESDEHAALAKEELDGLFLHSKVLKVANALPRACMKKRLASADDNGANESRESKPTDICDAVTPLAKLPYEQQLEKKRADVCQFLKKLVRNVRKASSPEVHLPEWVTDAKLKGGLCCQFDGVVASPLVDGYRNKCEFTIGHSLDGKRVVGFLLGTFREGYSTVMEPAACRNVSINAKKYVKAFQNFIQDSKLPLWNKSTNSGFWRLFTVREGRAAKSDLEIAEIMLIVQVCSTGVEESVKLKEYDGMVNALACFSADAHLPLSALLIQDHLGISNAASPEAPLFPLSIPQSADKKETGSNCRSFIHDHICNLRFRISPTAFFQVNILAAEKLYAMAADWAGLGSNTLVFDVCCGTGTIGLTLAHRVGMVIGIEMNGAAVADARTNAEINGIRNCLFVCGKAEDVMQSLLSQYLLEDLQGVADNKAQETLDAATEPPVSKESSNVENEDATTTKLNALESSADVGQKENMALKKFTSVVVLVDPPRSGLHPAVLKLLRTHEKICRLVYISCNPETLIANAVELCTPSGTGDPEKGSGQRGNWKRSAVGLARHRVKSMPSSRPFLPIKAVAVDLFPHTPHCEMIMLMER